MAKLVMMRTRKNCYKEDPTTISVCVYVCVLANLKLPTLSIKVDQCFPCERYHISRAGGKPL